MIALIATGAAIAGTTWEDATAARGDTISVTTLAERGARTDVLVDLVRSAPSGKIADRTLDRAKAVGLQVVRNGEALEVSEISHGSEGLYAIRLGPAPPVACAAPHPTYDRGTGEIVAGLFDRGTCRVALFATAPRDVIDLAHEPNTLFQSLSGRLPEAVGDLWMVQIHGFAPETTTGDAVLSDGAATLDPNAFAHARNALAAATGWSIADGGEVPALAARTNVQSKALAHQARFLHVELSAERRKALLDDPAQLAALSGGILAATRQATAR
jgi:hypothetical protein